MRWPIAVLLGLVAALPAKAAVRTDVGVLTCTLAEGGAKGSAPDSQTRAMLCSFKPKGTGPEESYLGEIKKVGSQTALSGKLVLIWSVMGPSDRKLKPAVLEQTYVGEITDSPLDMSSKSPKLLVGDRDRAYGLQPMSDEHEAEAADSVTVELRIKSTAS